MDPHLAQEIREAYYKAVEGLRSLADTLEIADAQLSNKILVVHNQPRSNSSRQNHSWN